jgi:release factor glutamine methyltransferase
MLWTEMMSAPAAETWSIGRLLEWTRGYLAEKGHDEPRLSAELLLAHALDCRKIELYTRYELTPTVEQIDAFRSLVRRAASHEPIAYLVGHKEFFSLDFEVTSAVLIPRPESELLVEQALEHCKRLDKPRFDVLDIGTGSGCLALAIAKLLPAAYVVATDVSGDALEIAGRNVSRHNLNERIRLLEADGLLLPSDAVPAGGFDVIVSNPPYIADGDVAGLPANIREYEPRIALAGGADGLDLVRRIASDGLRMLAVDGRCIVEAATGQDERVVELFASNGWRHEKTVRDLGGVPRTIVFGRTP